MSSPIPWIALVDVETLRAASDDELACTIGELVAEQRRRALESGDLAALAEDAFETWGFSSSGKAQLPRLSGGLLICPGYKREKSPSSHECGFVSLDSVWVWEHPDAVLDEMRTLPGGKVVRQTVTIVPAFEGMTFDFVWSTARSGPCRMRDASSFIVQNGKLVETSRRAHRPVSHR